MTVSSEALAMLSAYRWPGNVRELQNVIETAAVLARDCIEPSHLPAEISDMGAHHVAAASAKGPDDGLDDVLADLETRLITDALREAGGIQKRAAETLGIKERSLWHRVAKYGIDVAAFKTEKHDDGA